MAARSRRAIHFEEILDSRVLGNMELNTSGKYGTEHFWKIWN